MMNNQQPTIAFSSDFLTALLDLPKKIQKRTREFIGELRANPHSPGLNLERVKSKNGQFYSARINVQYRAILAFSKETNTYIIVHADKHDEAYKWAESKRFEVNKHTGAIQVYDDVSAFQPDFGAFADKTPMPSQPVVSAPAPVAAELADSTATSTIESPTVAQSPVVKVAQRQSPRQDMSNTKTGPLPEEYASLTEDDMLRFGVPDNFIPVMMNQKTWPRFNQWVNRLPPDAASYLQLVAEGAPRSEVLSLVEDGKGSSDMLGLEKNIPVSSIGSSDDSEAGDEFRRALANYSTQQSIVVVNGEEDLKRIFDSPLDAWRVFLHPSQRGYVERTYHGPYRLLGGAGTGKTVVAMHRAKHLAADLIRRHSSGKLLFTTYSANLATDIETNLRMICTNEELRKIDVLNLDKYIVRTFRKCGYDYEIWYGSDPHDKNKTIDSMWNQARSLVNDAKISQLGTPFFKDEWKQVIIPQQIDSLGAYLWAPRKGRGTRLGRAQKEGVWKVVEQYKQLMRQERACDIDMAMNMVAKLLHDRGSLKEYEHVIVDEGQDFSAPAYRIIRELVGEHDNDIFIVGDAQQRIYGRTVVLSKCGINIQGRARRLKINYRTTEEIRAAADRVFASSSEDVADSVFRAVLGVRNDDSSDQPELFDDLEGAASSGGDSRSLMHGPSPKVRRFPTQREEIEYVTKWIYDQCGVPSDDDDASSEENEGKTDPRNICIVARSNSLVKEWTDTIDDELPYGAYRLKGDGEDRQRPGIRVATMHRVKGLEFDYMIIVDVNAGVCPPRLALQYASDDLARKEVIKEERSLIYVSLTRARRGVMLLGVGEQLQS